MNNLINEIDGKRYVLATIPVVENDKNYNKMKKNFGVLFQAVKKVDRGGFFDNAFLVVNILIPEQRFVAWSKEYSKND